MEKNSYEHCVYESLDDGVILLLWVISKIELLMLQRFKKDLFISYY